MGAHRTYISKTPYFSQYAPAPLPLWMDECADFLKLFSFFAQNA